MALLALLTVVVVIVAIILITTPTPTRIVLRNVVYHDIHQASEALKQLIAENTQ
jgi:beta-lactam-binding protein with PASTA domain